MIGVLGAMLFVPPSHATDQGNIGEVSPKKTVIEKSYPPIIGLYPNTRAPLPSEVPSQVPRGAEPFANFKPEMCRTANWCDTHTLEIDYPDDYIFEVFFGVRVILTWDNPKAAQNPTGNDLDFFLWPDDDPTSGAPSTECQSPAAAACDEIHPEVITMIEPQDTVDPKGTPEVDQIPAILFTVVNHTGVNTGYTIRAEWFTFEVDFGDFAGRPKREGSGGTLPDNETEDGDVRGGIDPSSLRSVQGPRADRKIILPGPDGKPLKIVLPLVAAGSSFPEPEEGGGINVLPIALASLGGLGAALGAVTVVRRKRLSGT